MSVRERVFIGQVITCSEIGGRNQQLRAARQLISTNCSYLDVARNTREYYIYIQMYNYIWLNTLFSK